MKPRSEWKQPKRSALPPRRTYLQHGTTPIARSGPIRPRRKRTAAEERAKHEHDYGPPGFVEWIHRQPSVASGKGPCVAAHTKGRGAQLKGHWSTIVPLTEHEHTAELHQEMGHKTFEVHYGICLRDRAAETHARYLAERGAA